MWPCQIGVCVIENPRIYWVSCQYFSNETLWLCLASHWHQPLSDNVGTHPLTWHTANVCHYDSFYKYWQKGKARFLKRLDTISCYNMYVFYWYGCSHGRYRYLIYRWVIRLCLFSVLLSVSQIGECLWHPDRIQWTLSNTTWLTLTTLISIYWSFDNNQVSSTIQ